MSANVFESQLLGGLFGDAEVVDAFSLDSTLHHFNAFEAALLGVLASMGVVDVSDLEGTIERLVAFAPDVQAISAASARDGMPVPEYVRQAKRCLGEDFATSFHFGSTSQDLIDTAQALALRDVNSIFSKRLVELIAVIDEVMNEHGQGVLMARTRMQAALPVKVGDRIANWRSPLNRHIERLDLLSPKLHALQFGGPVGTCHAYQGKGKDVALRVAEELGLYFHGANTHTQRDHLSEYASWLSLVTGALGKIGQDICLMSQQGIEEIALSGGGSSSAMAHKQNPIQAELLVTLARYNATQVSAMHHALVHEQERSGSAWTLEWMILPQMCLATGAALRSAIDLLGTIERIGDP